jgi:hypothetical protein
MAALYIIYESVQKWITGLRLQNLGTGKEVQHAKVG